MKFENDKKCADTHSLDGEAGQSNQSLIKGVIQGSRKSFGFLLADSGDRYFVSPPSMKMLMNGDTALASIKITDGRKEAIIQHVLESNSEPFYGVVRVRRDCYWLEIESPFASNWMKIDNHDGLFDGDWVLAHVSAHPFDHDEGLVSVSSIVAKSSDKEMPWLLAKHRYAISDVSSDLSAIDLPRTCDDGYKDMTHIPFITIDSESTVDIDDAIFAEESGDEIKLYVAISDASSFVEKGSKLDSIARSRGATAYLPMETQPMLPRELIENHMSLAEGVTKGALVCAMIIDKSGDVSNIQFWMAKIKSRAKLSYASVDQFIDGGIDLGRGAEVNETILKISDAAMLLRNAREMDSIVAHYGDDIRMNINEFEITGFSSAPRNIAHIVVEECMIVANRAFAAYCKSMDIKCLYRTHTGIMKDHKQEAVAILNHWGIISEGDDIDDIQTFIGIMRTLELPEYSVPSALIKPFFDRGNYSTVPSAHMAMGLGEYATYTSPIRRYSDLVNQRIIKDHLFGNEPCELSHAEVAQINEASRQPILAAREVTKHLLARFFRNNKDRLCQGFITSINSGGIRVVDAESGASAFIVMRDIVSRNEMPRVHAYGSELWVKSDKHEGGELIISDTIRFRLGEAIRFKVSFVDRVSSEMQAFLVS